MQKRNAFTLVELLVVIGVIGILATMAMPRIGKAMDNAKEQQCRTNLRNLQAAVVAYAQDNDGALPRAQCFEAFESASRKWYERIGWVRWVPNSGSNGNSWEKKVNTQWSGDDAESSHSSEMADDTGCGEAAKWAVEYGSLFDYVGDIRSYRCPVIEREVKKRWSKSGSAQSFDEEDSALASADAKIEVWRTYAMNPYFGALSVGGGRDRWHPLSTSVVGSTHRYRDYAGSSGSSYRKSKFHTSLAHCPIPEPSKLLLFTEIIPEYQTPGTVEPRKNSGDFARGSGNLSKNACLDPEDPDGNNEFACWDPEEKGTEWEFGIHSSPDRGRHTALAVFYDGHIEKIDPRCGDSDQYNTVWFLNRGYAPGSLPE